MTRFNTFLHILIEEVISKNMKWGIRKKMQAGTYVNCATPFGYRQQDHQLVLEKDEAAVVRLVFEKYLSGWESQKLHVT